MQFVHYDMSAEDTNHLLYSTPPLTHDVEVTGFVIANLWVSSPGFDNVDVFVYLQLVDTEDSSAAGKYITEGCFRAEHRCVIA